MDNLDKDFSRIRLHIIPLTCAKQHEINTHE